MALNRVKRKKSDNYTHMCNLIMREKNISLKAKGLYAMVMSLPDDWVFSVDGMVAISKEENGAIYTAIKELINEGYCKRQMVVEKGRYVGCEYIFYEERQKIETEELHSEKPHKDFPHTENSEENKLFNKTNSSSINTTTELNNKEKRLSNDNQKEPDELFISFWEKYGYKRGKKDAVAAWKKLSKKDKEDAIKAILVYKEDCRVCDRQMRQPSVYLNKRTWEDDFTNNGKISKEEPTEEPAVIYPEGMTIEKWTEISLWMSSTVSYIAGRITPVQFDDMLRTCGDSVTLAKMLTEINEWAEFHRDDDVYEEFKRRIKDSEL